MIITPKTCGECPLWHESGYGTWCGHPSVENRTQSDPFAKKLANGAWGRGDWPDEDQMPERCPLKTEVLVIRGS